MIQLIDVAAQSVTEWAGGSTRELCISPADSSLVARNFRWRFSTAQVNGSGAFSDFSGYQRYLAIRSGNGLRLSVDAHQMHLRSPSYVAVFAGHANTSGELLDGAVRDINLIVRLDAANQPLADTELLPLQVSHLPCTIARPQAREWLVYADEASLTLRVADEEIQIGVGCVARFVASQFVLSSLHACACVVASIAAEA